MIKINSLTFIVFILLFSISIKSCAQTNNKNIIEERTQEVNKIPMENKMKVEIWSDVMCPFCYIGKRNFETALEQFADKEHIEIVWKSFILDPTVPEIPKESYLDYLVINKGLKTEQVQGMLDNVTQSAKQVGLVYDFDKSIMVNSLSAHKLLQFAKTKGLGDQAKERLLFAFFTEGKNIADLETLTKLGKEIGLNETEIKTAFTDQKYQQLVEQDIIEARQVDVQGVPFFVLDRKYAVSGAQPAQAFLKNLETAFAEWIKDNPETKLKITEGESCKPNGICD